MFIAKISGEVGSSILDFMKEIHSNEQGNILNANLLDVEDIKLEDKKIQELLKTNSRTIFLGEKHSLTYSIGKSFFDYCINEKKKSCLIVFGSHAGCSSGDWLKKLIEFGFPSENVLLVGARNLNQEEIKFTRENGIRILSMNSLVEDINDMCDIIMEFANGKELYVSIGVGVVDPAFAPAVDYPETGGLTSRQFLYLIQRIKKIKTLKAIDLVEINGEEDKKFNNITIKLGAKILAELI